MKFFKNVKPFKSNFIILGTNIYLAINYLITMLTTQNKKEKFPKFVLKCLMYLLLN